MAIVQTRTPKGPCSNAFHISRLFSLQKPWIWTIHWEQGVAMAALVVPAEMLAHPEDLYSRTTKNISIDPLESYKKFVKFEGNGCF